LALQLQLEVHRASLPPLPPLSLLFLPSPYSLLFMEVPLRFLSFFHFLPLLLFLIPLFSSLLYHSLFLLLPDCHCSLICLLLSRFPLFYVRFIDGYLSHGSPHSHKRRWIRYRR
jgi:hypothetical protein